MKTIQLKDGMILDKVKLSISFPFDFEEYRADLVEVHMEGWIVGVNGWYSNVFILEELGNIIEEEDLVIVKFALAKMNSLLRV